MQYRPNRLDKGQLRVLAHLHVLYTHVILYHDTSQAKKGGFKDTCPEELLAAVLREVYTRAKLDPSKIEWVAKVDPPNS
jgi:hypothetical protein